MSKYYIYILACDYCPGVYKIGFTKDPFKRINQINGQHPLKTISYLYLFYKWEYTDDTRIKQDERHLHIWLKDKKYYNEWFKLDIYNLDWISKTLKSRGFRDVLHLPHYKKLAPNLSEYFENPNYTKESKFYTN